MYASTRVFQSSPQASFHADVVIDSNDLDRSLNPGSSTDESLHIVAFREGLRGGVWRDRFEPALFSIKHILGTSVALLEYDGMIVGVAHVDQHGSIGTFQINEKMAAMIERFAGRVAL